jgi:thiamine transport system substrate-binding protein
MKRLAPLVVSAATCTLLTLSGCNEPTAKSTAPTKSVRLLTYDSFSLPKDIWNDFTAKTGLNVEVLAKGDTGEMLNTAILTKEAPIADVIWAVDRTFLSRAATSGIFVPHQLKNLSLNAAAISPLAADRLLPVDTAEVCVNVDSAALEKSKITMPASLDDLTKPEFKGQLVVENPATSAPGLSFLLATVERYGETGWQAYWKKLVTNKVLPVNGWTEAWETEFSGAGKGKHALVVSYSTSPVATVAFGADPNATSTPVKSLPDTCFATAEYSGVLAGTGNEANGRKLLEYLLSEKVQSELAMNMFVFPTRIGVALPEPYVRLGVTPTAPATQAARRKVTLTPQRIQAMRDVWIDEWTNIVLG